MMMTVTGMKGPSTESFRLIMGRRYGKSFTPFHGEILEGGKTFLRPI
jgi:hypothetical protein